MRKFFKTLLIVIGSVLVIAGIFAAYISLRSIPSFPVEKKDISITLTTARIEQGTKLASMLCKSCHYNDNTKKFTGRELTEAPQFGKIYSRNITHDSIAGIGKWTDGELVYFLRTGIRKDGQYVPPYMPKLIHISDEDLYSIIAFLRSGNGWVEADNTRMPVSNPSFLTNFLVTIGAAKPFSYPAAAITGPDTTDKVKWGKYIALYQLECYSCHSRDFAKNDYFEPEKSPGFFGGGNKMFTKEGKEIFTMNITTDEATGIGKWSEEEFIKAVKYGQVPNNQPALRYPMIPFSNLTDEEAKAVYAYIKTLPPIQNKVERKLTE